MRRGCLRSLKGEEVLFGDWRGVGTRGRGRRESLLELGIDSCIGIGLGIDIDIGIYIDNRIYIGIGALIMNGIQRRRGGRRREVHDYVRVIVSEVIHEVRVRLGHESDPLS